MTVYYVSSSSVPSEYFNFVILIFVVTPLAVFVLVLVDLEITRRPPELVFPGETWLPSACPTP